MKRGIVILAIMGLVTLTGCRATGYLFYVLCPWAGERTVDAEFEGLKNKTVAVVVYADENIQYNYNPVQVDLSAMVSADLQKNIQGLTAIDPRKIVAYQRGNLAWDEMELGKIGKDLGSDYVLFISLIEFSTVEEGYLDLLRAQITAEVSLYDTTQPPRQSRVWKGDDIHVAYPQTPAARVGDNEHQFRMTCMQMFAQQLGKKFYKHKEKLEK